MTGRSISHCSLPSHPSAEGTRKPSLQAEEALGARASLREEGKRVGGEQLPLLQGADGCGSPLHRLRSPLHSGPGSPAGGSFCLEPPGLRRSLDEDEPPPSPLARYRPLHNAASHEGLAAASGSPPRSAASSDSSPSFVRRHPRAELHSEGEQRPVRRPLPASTPLGSEAIGRTSGLAQGGSGEVGNKDHGSFIYFQRALMCARHCLGPGTHKRASRCCPRPREAHKF